MFEYVKPYLKFGSFAGASEKCDWTTQLTETTRCFVSNRKFIDWSTDYPCTKAENFGYARGMPCVLLKVTTMSDSACAF